MNGHKRKIKTSLQILLVVTTILLVLGVPSSTLVGESSGASLTGVISDEGVDTDADGKFDYLQIGVEVNVTDPGNYLVWVSRLLDSKFEQIDVDASNFTFLGAGMQVVYLYLVGPRIYMSNRDPEYIEYLELWCEKDGSFSSLNQFPLSGNYSYKDFDPPGAMLTGKIDDRGVDTDGDVAYNYLEISIEINVTKAGVYSVYVSGLRDIHKDYISVWGSESGYFDVGLGVLNVLLYGPSIYASHRNPESVDYISLYADYHSYLQGVPLSKKYMYTEFDFPAALTGVISDQGVDTDADDSFDYLEIGVQVNVSDPETYVIYVSGLLDADSNYISVRDSKTIYLDAGIQTVYLYLYGPEIYVTRRNPSKVSYVSLTVEQDKRYYYYYDTLRDVPLSRNYSYTDFEAPFMDAEAKFVVYPDGRVTVEGTLKYTNMAPQNRGPTAQGFFNFTDNGGSTQASTGLTLTLPPELATEFPYNSTTAELLAEYSNGLLDLGINSTMILPPIAKSLYPYNATDGTLTATYSGGILNAEVNCNTTLPPIVASQFPFNATDFTMVGDYSENLLDGTITFHILPGYPFGDVDVDFTGTKTDLTLNGTVIVVFGVPFEDVVIWNSTDLDQKLDELKSTLLGENGIVWNMTGGLLNVTNLDFSVDPLNEWGASVTFRLDVHGDFVQALAYLMSGGRDEMLLYPVLNEAYSSAQNGSFRLTYAHTSREASIKLTFAYNLEAFVDYVLTPPEGTVPYVMMGHCMSPTILAGDVVFVEAVANAGDIIADPETGDIIAFHQPSEQNIIIHRAVNKTYEEGMWKFTTKGDANASPDPWLVPENLVLGKVDSRVPFYGYMLSYGGYGYDYYPYPQNTTAALSLDKAIFSSVQSMSIQLSYSSVDMLLDFKLTQVNKLKTLKDEFASLFPETLPPETPPELKWFVESLLNTTYASVNSARVSLLYEDGTADFEGTATIEGDLNAELNYVKDIFFKYLGTEYGRYNMTIPWQLDFLNQTQVDVSNLKISAKLDETSVEGRFEGLIFLPPTDAINATHFKLERFFNLTTPEYPAEPFPGQDQRLRITIEGGKNATHSVVLFRPPAVPEPNITAPDRSSMVWFNQTINGLKDLVFEIQLLANGTLTVTTTPVAGEVFVNGESWGTAPQSQIVEIGTYTVSFGSVEGYHTPPDQVATVYKNQETVVEGVYTEISPGTLTVTTKPVAGEIFVNGSSWGVAPQSRVVQAGTYIVSFGDVDGFYTPADQVATISENVETTIEGVYEPVPGVVVVEEITEPELVNATNPLVVDATEEAATSLIISEISDPITVVVQNVTEPEGVEPPPGTWEVLGTYVQITVNNTDITVNATIRIYYTLEQLEASGLDESTLEIHFWNAISSEWEPVESHVNTEEHYVWAIIDHFSLFAILGQPSEGEAPLITQLWFLAIVSIVIIAVILVSVIYIRRRKTAITHSNQRP